MNEEEEIETTESQTSLLWSLDDANLSHQDSLFEALILDQKEKKKFSNYNSYLVRQLNSHL